MLSAYFVALQAFEVVAYGFLAAWMDLGPAATVVFIVAALLSVRFGFVAASFALAWIHRAPRAQGEQIDAARAVAMVLREWLALSKQNLVDAPWNRLRVRPDPIPPAAAGPAVVMAHGYFENRGCFRELVVALEAGGVRTIFTPTLRSWLTSIGRYEAELTGEIERVHRATGHPVIVIAHSMGGLGTRLHLARHGTAMVARVLTIASPHRGSALARLAVGPNAAEMCPGCDFLERLASVEGPRGPSVPFTSFYSPHDNMVAPQDSSRLPWARNVALPGYGHLDIMRSPELHRMLLAELREAGAVA